MKPKIILPEHAKEDWIINEEFIIDSKYRYDNEPMLKFCYQPDEDVITFVLRTNQHKDALRMINRNFDDFVRGIYFRHKKKIYLRLHKKEWLLKTKKMLEENGLPKDIEVVWGDEWAEKLKDDLRGL